MARRERRRLCKFISDWTTLDEFSSWLAPVKGEKHKAFCLLCKKVFAVSHGGLNDVKAHYKGKKHIWLQRQQEKIAAGLSNQWNSPEDSWVKGIFYEQEHSVSKFRRPNQNTYFEEGRSTLVWDIGVSSLEVPANIETMSMQPKMLPQQYCLRWKYHHNNLQVMFSQLLERESFCDVTLACEGKTLRAHKVVLSACSTYFDSIFSQYEEKNPIVILKDVKFADIKALVEFMYKGEINIDHSHLASLLKAAEDLRIKGLAEVSWRSEGQAPTGGPSGPSCPSGQSGPAAEETVNCSESHPGNDSNDVEQEPPVKRKRGRPPIDGASGSSFSPKVLSISGAVGTDDAFTEGAGASDADGDNDVKPWEEQDSELVSRDSASDAHNVQGMYGEQESEVKPSVQPVAQHVQSTAATPTHNEASSCVSQRIAEQYRDVVKLNDYLTTGRRQQFWEEPFTRRIMEAIKSKELEMKAGAELLGVSYGTLYGRYRDAYGCLKHPYRISTGAPVEVMSPRPKGAMLASQLQTQDRHIVRDFWSESGPADVLAKVQRKEISLFRAAEMLNVTVTTLAHYLSTLQPGGVSSGDEGADETRDPEDFYEGIRSTTPKKTATAALENNPDITIVKQEPTVANHDQDEDDDDEDDDDMSSSSVATNNNAEHADSDGGQNEHANGMEAMEDGLESK